MSDTWRRNKVRPQGVNLTEIEWVVSAYVLPFAALLLAAGAYADRHGRKRATLLGGRDPNFPVKR